MYKLNINIKKKNIKFMLVADIKKSIEFGEFLYNYLQVKVKLLIVSQVYTVPVYAQVRPGNL